MKSEKTIKAELEQLKKDSSSSANMNYERGGAIEALEWVLSKESGHLTAGHRL